MKKLLRVSSELVDMQLNVIHDFLKDSYWSPGIPKQLVKKALSNSICFGVFDRDKQIAFARAVTDRATFSYLADVFVLPSYRGEGVSKMLLEEYFKHPDLQGIRRHMLATSDAHGLYEKFGFERSDGMKNLMHKVNPRIYQKVQK